MNNLKNRKMLITGGSGVCASWLWSVFPEATYTDIRPLPDSAPKNLDFRLGDLSDRCFCDELVKGCSIVVHLGGASSPNAELEEVVRSNILGAGNLIRSSIIEKVDKFIFASTNHAVGLVEKKYMPGIYYDASLVSSDDRDKEYCPDGYYGASKVFTESLLDYFVSESSNSSAISLRIGTIWPRDIDDDFAEANQYMQMCKSNNIQYSEQIVQDKIQRQKLFRVSGSDWQKKISQLLSDEWVGHKVVSLTSNNESWLKKEYR